MMQTYNKQNGIAFLLSSHSQTESVVVGGVVRVVFYGVVAGRVRVQFSLSQIM